MFPFNMYTANAEESIIKIILLFQPLLFQLATTGFK